jgi:hypothetical protein
MFPQLLPIPRSFLSFGSPLMVVHADNWDYKPMTEWGEGDLNAERAIRKELATPSRQIGIISEAVDALVANLNSLVDVLASENATPEQIKRCAKSINGKREHTDRLHRLVEKVAGIKKNVKAKPPPTVI